MASKDVSQNHRNSKARVSFLLNSEHPQTTAPPKTSPSPPTREERKGTPSNSLRQDGQHGAEFDRLRKFVCEKCGFGFYTKSNLRKHVSSVHLQLRPFKCSLCNQTFGEKSNATKHYKSVHMGEKNAACKQCNAVFAFKDGLVRHVRLVHEGVRKFRCPIAGCRSDAFKQSAHLKKHLSTVHKKH